MSKSFFCLRRELCKIIPELCACKILFSTIISIMLDLKRPKPKKILNALYLVLYMLNHKQTITNKLIVGVAVAYSCKV